MSFDKLLNPDHNPDTNKGGDPARDRHVHQGIDHGRGPARDHHETTDHNQDHDQDQDTEEVEPGRGRVQDHQGDVIAIQGGVVVDSVGGLGRARGLALDQGRHQLTRLGSHLDAEEEGTS